MFASLFGSRKTSKKAKTSPSPLQREVARRSGIKNADATDFPNSEDREICFRAVSVNDFFSSPPEEFADQPEAWTRYLEKYASTKYNIYDAEYQAFNPQTGVIRRSSAEEFTERLARRFNQVESSANQATSPSEGSVLESFFRFPSTIPIPFASWLMKDDLDSKLPGRVMLSKQIDLSDCSFEIQRQFHEPRRDHMTSVKVMISLADKDLHSEDWRIHTILICTNKDLQTRRELVVERCYSQWQTFVKNLINTNVFLFPSPLLSGPRYSLLDKTLFICELLHQILDRDEAFESTHLKVFLNYQKTLEATDDEQGALYDQIIKDHVQVYSEEVAHSELPKLYGEDGNAPKVEKTIIELTRINKRLRDLCWTDNLQHPLSEDKQGQVCRDKVKLRVELQKLYSMRRFLASWELTKANSTNKDCEIESLLCQEHFVDAEVQNALENIARTIKHLTLTYILVRQPEVEDDC